MTILIAYDGSDDAKAAIGFTGSLLRGEPAVVLTVWERLAMNAARASVGMVISAEVSAAEDQAIGDAMKELAQQGLGSPAPPGSKPPRSASPTGWPCGRRSWTWPTNWTPN